MRPPLYDLIAKRGNKKLPSSTAIFNMHPAHNCIAKKLGLCKAAEQGAKCYAFKAEYLYPNVLPYRKRQEKFWKKISAEKFANQFMAINAVKRKKFTMLRLSESGDFFDQTSVDKAEEIAKRLNTSNIKMYTYTSRSDLNFSKCENLIVVGSGFMKKGLAGQFNIVKNLKNRPKGFGICPMNCRKCNRCSTRGMKTIVKAH